MLPHRVFPTVLVLVGCCFGGQTSPADELQPLLTHVAPRADRDYGRSRQLVVIYYGNDIEAPTSDNPVYENMNAFRRKIEQIQGSDAFDADAKARLADISELVWKRQGDIIADSAEDISWLRQAAQQKQFVLATVRNFGNTELVFNHEPRTRLFRTIEWEHGPYTRLNAESVSESFGIEAVRIPYDLGDVRFRFSALSHPAVFREVLEGIVARFPSKDYCHLLIVRSPTTRESMLTDILTADIDKLDALRLAEVVLEAVVGVDLLSVTTEQVADRVNQAIVDAFLTPELERLRAAFEKDMKASGGFLKYGSEFERRVSETREFGASKLEFFQALNSFSWGENTAFFPLVVLGGLHSRLEYGSDAEVKEILAQSPGNYEAFSMGHIGWLFAQGDKPVDISESIRKAAVDESPDFAGSLRRHLAPHGE